MASLTGKAWSSSKFDRGTDCSDRSQNQHNQQGSIIILPVAGYVINSGGTVMVVFGAGSVRAI